MDRTLKVWDLARDIITSFSGEGIILLSVAPDGLTVVAGDGSGRVHILRLENITPGPPSSPPGIHPSRAIRPSAAPIAAPGPKFPLLPWVPNSPAPLRQAVNSILHRRGRLAAGSGAWSEADVPKARPSNLIGEYRMERQISLAKPTSTFPFR